MNIYHILGKEDWGKAREKGFYSPGSLDKEGFIHCSTKEQILSTANRLFKGRKDLLLLVINPNKIKAKIIYEDLKGKGQKHPHIYGKLLLNAIESQVEFKPDKDGNFNNLPSLN